MQNASLIPIRRRTIDTPINRAMAALAAAAVTSFALLACGGGGSESPTVLPQDMAAAAELTVHSSSFQAGSDIPVEHTCDGNDASPQLAWSPPPPGTRSIVIIVDDPDAPRGPFIHWTLYNLPGDLRSLDAGVRANTNLDGGIQGENDFGRIGYGGPCPPAGPAHEYRFWVYALAETLSLEPRSKGGQVIAAMRGRVIAVGNLSGTYTRK